MSRLDRWTHNPELFSRFSMPLSSEQQSELLTNVYFPYRNNVEQLIKSSTKPVLHLSIHTFTPVLKNEVRGVDIGLLFDPERKQESNFCHDLKTHLSNVFPDLSIKDNEPYKGIEDGFTTYLRTVFGDHDYLGIEVEINQKFVSALNPIKKGIGQSLKNVLRTL